MSNARNLADIVTGNFDVPLGALDNVPPSNDASALTTGTLPVGRLPSSGVDASALTTGTLGTSRLPAGSVLQVVSNVTPTAYVSYDGNHLATNLEATITPSSASSKILVLMNPSLSVNGSGGSNATCLTLVKRNNGNVLHTYFRNYDYSAYGLYMSIPIFLSVLDSPNTTSPALYRFEFALQNGSNAQLNPDGGYSSVTLMEIAA